MIRDKARSMKRLLEAVRELIVVHGVERMNIKATTDRAGVSRTSFVRHFGTWDEMMEALFQQVLSRINITSPVTTGNRFNIWQSYTLQCPNSTGFWVNTSDKPLIWFNSNYKYSRDHAEVKIVLKNYPAGYNLKWWFFGTDMIDAKTTGEELAARITNDDDGADYDSGFLAMPSAGRSFRAPKGIGFVMIRTLDGRYEAVRLNVGEPQTVTFTAP